MQALLLCESDLCSKERIIDFPNIKNKMFKYLVVIIYSLCVAAVESIIE